MATPTIDDTATRFSTPTWSIKVNGTPNTDAVLERIVLQYGPTPSSAVFSIQQDPDTGSFPAYNDNIEVIVNGRSVLKGKIKGITSKIQTQGLQKTFTVLSTLTTLLEKVVDPDNKDFNAPIVKEKELPEDDRLSAREILSQILGFIPSGTPDEDPGELHLTDLTHANAVEAVVRRLGNFKLFWNQNTDLLEIYKFGQGGDITRQFEKGVNIIDLAITENRKAVVDKLTLIGAPKLVRVQKIVDTSIEPDENGVHRITFNITDANPRNIIVEGSQRAQPSFAEQTIEVSPSDMGLPPGTALVSTLPEGSNVPVITEVVGVPVWPTFGFSIPPGNTQGDNGTRHALKEIIIAPSFFGILGSKPDYISKNLTKVFVSDAPKIWETRTVTAFVDNTVLGIDRFGKTSVSVLTALFWFRGAIRVTYTREEDAPTFTSGSGATERTLTDTQYQIVEDFVSSPSFTNEAKVLERMQERLDAEFERVNRPNIGGSITIPGDETVDLKSSVLVTGTKLDVVSVVHSFTRGFTTTVTLTNEPFFRLTAVPVPTRPARTSTEQARVAGNDFRIGFVDLTGNQERATQKTQEFQQEPGQATSSIALLQD